MQALSRNPIAKTSANKWLLQGVCQQATHLRLFCFPHAGGNANNYIHWQNHLSPGIQLNVLQLPGRTSRMQETPVQSMDELVTAIVEGISPYLDKPFAFFGHSMGAIVAYEVCQRLRSLNKPLPRQLMVSSCRGPSVPRPYADIHALPFDDLLSALQDLNGTPSEALANRELMAMMEPSIRADFKVIETRVYTEQAPLDLPITALGGKQDSSVSTQDLQAWKQHTDAGFWLKLYDGDHFYHVGHEQALLRQICELMCMQTQIAI